MSWHNRKINDIEVEIQERFGYSSGNERGSVYFSIDDNQGDDCEIYGWLDMSSREDVDWLISHLTAARDVIWPAETAPNAPSQLPLIASMVSAGRDDELATLRNFAATTRILENQHREYLRSLQDAADRLARAAESATEQMPDHSVVDLLAWAAARYEAVSNKYEIERLEREFKAELKKIEKQEGQS